MSINQCALSSHRQASLFALAMMTTLSLTSSLQPQNGMPESTTTSEQSGLVLLVDVSPDQAKVFKVEQALATGVVEQLRGQGLVFSLIAFGSEELRQVGSRVDTDKMLSLLRDLPLESAARAASPAPKLYEALTLVRSQLLPAGKGEVVILSGGRDNLNDQHFKVISSGLRHDQIVCHVAIVSSHPLYGTKGIQVRGYYLHSLAGKAHGKYVELGSDQKRLAAAVSELSENIVFRMGGRSQKSESTISGSALPCRNAQKAAPERTGSRTMAFEVLANSRAEEQDHAS